MARAPSRRSCAGTTASPLPNVPSATGNGSSILAPMTSWQMDFKGHFPTRWPVPSFDHRRDHSRSPLAFRHAPRATGTVQERLRDLPRLWPGPAHGQRLPLGQRCRAVWLLRLGIRVSHGRPYHPQTQGKGERFHRTLKAEVLQGRHFAGPGSLRSLAVYNMERPHQALELAVPISRYAPSPRRFPETLSPITYGDADLVRNASRAGVQGGQSTARHPVALRPRGLGRVWGVWFMALSQRWTCAARNRSRRHPHV